MANSPLTLASSIRLKVDALRALISSAVPSAYGMMFICFT